MKTVVIGLSGGVDSSVSAYLLKQQGYKVIGLHMKGENIETSKQDEQRVKELCQTLNIECVIVDYQNYMQTVKDYFIKEYQSGYTPNPCVICNREVKFKPFLQYMLEYGADYFATGHYARIEHTENGHFLKKAKDEDKDQSYFLCQLTSEQLSKAMFPLGELTKQQVKQIALENNLISPNTKESYDICFLGSKKFKDYMQENYPEKHGNIIDESTNQIVGTHTGISKYTIGQRKGLNIGGKSGFKEARWFVTKKDVKTNTLYVNCGDGDILYSSGCRVENFNWINAPTTNNFNSYVKLRYHQPDQATKVEILKDGNVVLTFSEKQRAVTLGQFAVLYLEDGTCLGGGRIASKHLM